MALSQLIPQAVFHHLLLTLSLFSFGCLLIRSIYRIYFHPLSHIPGPLLPRLTSIWLHYHAYIGDEASRIHDLHKRWGSLVRVAPNEVDISDVDAIQPIYVSKGGFPKAPCYANFDIDGHKTIFSTTDTEYRSRRAKAVMPLFSTKSIRENDAAILGCVDRLVGRLREEAITRKPVNLINLSRSLAVDVVSTHLFQANYNGVEEKGQTLSASAFVDAFVAVGRFFYLPTLVFTWVEWLIDILVSDARTKDSMATVDHFVETLVKGATNAQANYPSKLMAAGLSISEIKAQCKDLIFAGTDSTGMNLAMIVRNLVLYPDKYRTLKEEIDLNVAKGGKAEELQALPYLSAVVKEGLRISMANPTRLPHVVPSEGWTFKSVYFPSGSIMGCSAFELHMNTKVFPQPRQFLPERWLATDNLESMNKHWFAFGAGSRACIARNLATIELYIATEKIVKSGVMEGARCVDGGDVQISEWFNSKVKGEKIDIIWDN